MKTTFYLPLLLSLLFISCTRGEKKNIQSGKPDGFAVYQADSLIPGKFLHDFLVIGPFPNPLPEGMTEYFHTDDACLGFAKDYLRSAGGEKGVKPYEGQTVEYGAGKRQSWQILHSETDKVDLRKIFNPHDKVVCYAALWIISDKRETKRFGIGSNDGVKVWFNGKQILKVHKPRTVKIDNEYLKLNLHRGKNLLLLKIDQSFGGWGLVLRPVNREIAWQHIQKNPDVAMNSEFYVKGNRIEGTVGDKDVVGKIDGLPEATITFRSIERDDIKKLKAPLGTFLKLKKKDFPAREYAITYTFPTDKGIHHSYAWMNTEGDIITETKSLLYKKLPVMPPCMMADYYKNFQKSVQWLDKANKLWHHPYGYRRYLDGLKNMQEGANNLSTGDNPIDGIFPAPRIIGSTGQKTQISSGWKLYNPDRQNDFITSELQRIWKKEFQTPPIYTDDPKEASSIRLLIKNDSLLQQPGSYVLAIDKDHVSIKSASRQGLYYGVNTFLQLMEETDSLPSCTIVDGPVYPVRSTLGSASRLTPDFQKKIDRLARFRYNVIFLTSANYQHLDDPARLKAQQEIIRYCKSRFIEPVPYLETFGGGTITRTLGPCFDEGIFHKKEAWKVSANGTINLPVPRILDCPSSTVHVFTPVGKELIKDKDFKILSAEKPVIQMMNKDFINDTLFLSYDAVDFSLFPHPATCPSIPEGWAYEEKILSNVIKKLHPSSLHIGQDEAGFVNKDSRCKARGLTNREIMMDEIQHVHRIIRKYDKKINIYMWGDMFNDFQNAKVIGATGAVDGVPKDIILLDWNYIAVYHSDKMQTIHQLNFYFDRGFRAGGAAWFEPANVMDILMTGEKRGKQFIGVMFTDWAGFGQSFYPVADANWTGNTLLGKLTF